MLNLTRLQRLSLMGLVAGMAAGLTLFALRGVIMGPRIVIHTPLQQEVPADRPVRIFGQAFQTTRLTLNGSQLPLDVQGYFEALYDPAPGLNYLALEASDRLGRTRRLVVTLVATSKEAYTPSYEQKAREENTTTGTTTSEQNAGGGSLEEE